ncbi:hypothetical protein, partial [Mesorhizobium sp. M1374]|uniref:hypothetical protein n=1 Tax=Mesorhizobium sp. M1374 TaxID=2957091 RepID=UPI003335F79C
MPDNLDQIAAAAAEDIKIAGKRLCGAQHNRIYASGEIMWRSRPDARQGRPSPTCLRRIIFHAS